ncbi:hypothetical protein THAOC_01243, partial [Thalassiosira oceanica]
ALSLSDETEHLGALSRPPLTFDAGTYLKDTSVVRPSDSSDGQRSLRSVSTRTQVQAATRTRGAGTEEAAPHSKDFGSESVDSACQSATPNRQLRPTGKAPP